MGVCGWVGFTQTSRLRQQHSDAPATSAKNPWRVHAHTHTHTRAHMHTSTRKGSERAHAHKGNVNGGVCDAEGPESQLSLELLATSRAPTYRGGSGPVRGVPLPRLPRGLQGLLPGVTLQRIRRPGGTDRLGPAGHSSNEQAVRYRRRRQAVVVPLPRDRDWTSRGADASLLEPV